MDYAKHISELAARFHVRLNVERDMPPEAASSAIIVHRCPNCGRGNRLRTAGVSRCGACKHPLGNIIQTRVVNIAPVLDETTYAVALHELGHALHPTGRVRDSHGSRTTRTTGEVATLEDMRYMLLEERSAWEWARQFALEWTAPMQFVQDYAMGSYVASARKLGLDANGQPTWRRR